MHQKKFSKKYVWLVINLAIKPLMLKKQPDIVTTVRKMRKYIGPREPEPNPQVCYF